ncbi:M20/M25/M40 family metallo-hydrolase [Lapidilactobacillus luobeiensis]|uniref:M20/M25/M40 family metallo-hydrolase n=1 Tax=Lapidilactobacillus luobeiensis TaxID=2950371 RepID=UPI0021C4981D|nr:M20/M25/M40 family metallo-hydrolase [Lapidilactobacillus luobeiensis]
MERQTALQILDALIKIPTVNGCEGAVAVYLRDLLDRYQISSHLIPLPGNDNRVNLIAEIGPQQGPILGFTGHQDTVAVSTPQLWTYGPFWPEHRTGRIYGRGAADMKSGLVAMVVALIALKQDPHFQGRVRLLATVGEELGELGAHQLTQLGYARDLSALVVGEPSTASSSLVLQRLGGSGLVTLPTTAPERYGRHLIFRGHKGSLDYSVTATGKAVHSALPGSGVNAIDNLLTFYQAQQTYFSSLESVENDLLGATKAAVTVIRGGEQPNTIPEQAQLHVKVRTIPEYPNQRIEADLTKLVNDLNDADPRLALSLTILTSQPAVITSASAPLVQAATTAFQKIWHESALILGAPGGTDASQFIQDNPNLPMIIAGPGNESAHQIDEYVNQVDFWDYCELYQLLAKIYFCEIPLTDGV